MTLWDHSVISVAHTQAQALGLALLCLFSSVSHTESRSTDTPVKFFLLGICLY